MRTPSEDAAMKFVQVFFGSICEVNSPIGRIVVEEDIEERGRLWLELRKELKIDLAALLDGP